MTENVIMPWIIPHNNLVHLELSINSTRLSMIAVMWMHAKLPWWWYYMETLSAVLAFCEGNWGESGNLVQLVDFLHKRSIIRTIHASVMFARTKYWTNTRVVGDTPWRSCDITVMSQWPAFCCNIRYHPKFNFKMRYHEMPFVHGLFLSWPIV